MCYGKWTSGFGGEARLDGFGVSLRQGAECRVRDWAGLSHRRCSHTEAVASLGQDDPGAIGSEVLSVTEGGLPKCRLPSEVFLHVREGGVRGCGGRGIGALEVPGNLWDGRDSVWVVVGVTVV